MGKPIQSPHQIDSIEDREALATALARTYGGDRDPWERIQEYQRVLEYTAEHPNKGSTAVANALDMPRGRIRPWMDSDAKPDPVRGIQAAESHDWLDLSWEHDVFVGLNALVAWVFSGGSITVDTFVPYFAVSDQADQERLALAFEHIGVEPEVNREGEEGRATEIRPADHGAVLGRLLHVLGAPVGTKNAENQLSLPAYLDGAPRPIRLNFARAYVLNRQTARGDRPNTPIQLHEERTGSYRQDLIEFLGDVVGDSDEIRGGVNGEAFLLTQRAASLLSDELTL